MFARATVRVPCEHVAHDLTGQCCCSSGHSSWRREGVLGPARDGVLQKESSPIESVLVPQQLSRVYGALSPKLARFVRLAPRPRAASHVVCLPASSEMGVTADSPTAVRGRFLAGTGSTLAAILSPQATPSAIPAAASAPHHTARSPLAMTHCR